MFFNHGLSRTGFANARPGRARSPSAPLGRARTPAAPHIATSGRACAPRTPHWLVAVCIFFALALTSFAADPGITVSARQRYPWNGLVDVHFTITGDAGTKYDTSFTATDMVGNTNIAMRTIRKADGTTAATMEQLLPGTYNWVWDAAADLPKEFQCDRVTVTGTAVETVHLYMVIDLSAGSSASSYPVSYLDSVPSGGWGDTYKGNKLVLRRVAKGSNSVAGSMSSDMLVGIFEVTQLQYKNVMNKTPSSDAGNYKPLEHAGYPACQEFLTKLSSRTGYTFRLPTRNEWRYACRAGSTANPFSATAKTARYMSNSHVKVGSYTANNWGLYDMLGNVGEWTSTGYADVTSQNPGYSFAYKSNILGGSYATTSPTDETSQTRGTPYGGDEEEGFRVFGIAK